MNELLKCYRCGKQPCECGLLRYLRQRLKNTRQRAAYWSGRPSWRNFGFVPGNRGRPLRGHHDLEYEAALDDLHLLADQIEEITGNRPKTTDYQSEFRKMFARAASR